MSGSASASDDDATYMTRDGSASRTFRSIFSGAVRQDNGELDLGEDSGGELKLHSFQRSDSNGHNGDDEDDDGVWSDDGSSPLPRKALESGSEDGDGEMRRVEHDNNSHAASEQHADDDEQDALAADGSSSDASASAAPRVPADPKIPHRRSMEEWADDDDEEDTWKDMLQAKVNQLELAIQSNDDAASGARTESRIALAAATHITALRAPSDRPASRNKIQRTTGSHTGAVGGSLAPSGTVSSPSNYLRKRSGPRDLSSSLVSKLCGDSKRSAKVPASASRRESLPRSASASAITRPGAARVPRKNSLDACSTGSLRSKPSGSGSSRSSPETALGNVTTASELPLAAQRAISDAEAVRRFLLHDIKQMSMDRLVADAKRLRFLEEFYRQQRRDDSDADAEPPLRAA